MGTPNSVQKPDNASSQGTSQGTSQKTSQGTSTDQTTSKATIQTNNMFADKSMSNNQTITVIDPNASASVNANDNIPQNTTGQYSRTSVLTSSGRKITTQFFPNATVNEDVSADLPISTNRRCGFEYNTRCPAKSCCSEYGWCGGEKGTADTNFCTFTTPKGKNNGKFDGR